MSAAISGAQIVVGTTATDHHHHRRPLASDENVRSAVDCGHINERLSASMPKRASSFC